MKLNKNQLLLGVAVLVIVVTGILILVTASKGSGNFSILSGGSQSPQAIAKKSIDYLNKNVLQGRTATLGTVTKENGVIKMQVKIDNSSYDSYATADGKLFFPEAFMLDGASATPSNNTTASGKTTVDIKNVNTAGQPFVGSATAPVVLAEWADYQCPFCKKMEQEVMPQFYTDYVKTGKVKIVYKDYEFLGADSQTLGQFARAVWAVAPDKFWDWHKAMFDNQGTENTDWATHAKIMSITTAAIGASDASKVSQLVSANASTYQKLMDADKAEGSSFGISGTPGFILGTQVISGYTDYATLKADVEAVLNKK